MTFYFCDRKFWRQRPWRRSELDPWLYNKLLESPTHRCHPKHKCFI